jgi:hypothetical protein
MANGRPSLDLRSRIHHPRRRMVIPRDDTLFNNNRRLNQPLQPIQPVFKDTSKRWRKMLRAGHNMLPIRINLQAMRMSHRTPKHSTSSSQGNPLNRNRTAARHRLRLQPPVTHTSLQDLNQASQPVKVLHLLHDRRPCMARLRILRTHP